MEEKKQLEMKDLSFTELIALKNFFNDAVDWNLVSEGVNSDYDKSLMETEKNIETYIVKKFNFVYNNSIKKSS